MIKFLVMDVDGTLTDGKIYMGLTGETLKVFNVKDGCGIKDILPKYGIIPVIITARKSKMLERRCEELGITEYHQGIREKLQKLQDIIENYKKKDGIPYTLSECAYIGDDILDLPCMEVIQSMGGIVGCPNDAVDEVKTIADYISSNNAGNGAVREFIHYIVTNNEKTKLDDKIEKAIAFVSKVDVEKAAIGRYDIDQTSYYMIQEYTTKNKLECRLESHRDYVDVQWIIKGREEIDTVSIANLVIEEEYNSEKDVMFWKRPMRMQKNILGPNSYVVLYPENAHMPCIEVENPMQIKKIVIKIKI